MVFKKTKMQKLISTLGSELGVHYTEKTYINLERIFKSYRAHTTSPFKVSIVKKEPLSEIVPKIYSAFLSSEPLSYDLVNKFVIIICSDENFHSLYKKTMEKLKDFGDETGFFYYEIMRQLYCTDVYPSQKNICASLNISRNKYNYLKVEATMALGIIFWGEIMKYWNNIEAEAAEIEKASGRENMLSSICDLSQVIEDS